MKLLEVSEPRSARLRVAGVIAAFSLMAAACGGDSPATTEAAQVPVGDTGQLQDSMPESSGVGAGVDSIRAVEETANDALLRTESLELALGQLEDRLEAELSGVEYVESEVGVAGEPNHPPRSGLVHWSYSGAEGPENWSKLSSDFGVCESGIEQSPIEIAPRKTFFVGLDDLSIQWNLSQIEVVDNGHTIQANVARGNTTTFEGRMYDLVQFHFHRPSEHTVNGEPFPMELHFVHADSSGGLAVIGVLLDVGNTNPAFAAVWSAQAALGRDAIVENFDLNALLPRDLERYRYSGSLTTPPCSEGVNWNVLAEPVELSRAQIDSFLYWGNARPVQDLNGRSVLSDGS